MNLHICSDEKFIDQLYDKFNELEILDNNRFVCNTRGTKLKNINSDIPFAKLDSKKFNSIVGDTEGYDNVFIHCLSPGYYYWIVKNKFKSLHWLVWGSDLYNQNFSNFKIYEPITASLVRNYRNDYYEKLRIFVKNYILRPLALKKVSNILTWMPFEFELAKQFCNKDTVHNYYFYLNRPFDFDFTKAVVEDSKKYFILGNSCTFSNNHLDALNYLKDISFDDQIIMPLSYGKMNYKKILKRLIDKESYPFKIELLEDFLSMNEYVQLLVNSRGFIFNNLRPQAVGNIWLAMILKKPVFLNRKNPLYDHLNSIGFKVFELKDLQEIEKIEGQTDYLERNKNLHESLFANEKSDDIYLQLFSSSSKAPSTKSIKLHA